MNLVTLIKTGQQLKSFFTEVTPQGIKVLRQGVQKADEFLAQVETFLEAQGDGPVTFSATADCQDPKAELEQLHADCCELIATCQAPTVGAISAPGDVANHFEIDPAMKAVLLQLLNVALSYLLSKLK